ncbi:MAG: PEGA domain-containing protein, partial [Myxococcota bacterium]|nr:PEGA domain-containing protein [Myxococcota bacterium]
NRALWITAAGLLVVIVAVVAGVVEPTDSGDLSSEEVPAVAAPEPVPADPPAVPGPFAPATPSEAAQAENEAERISLLSTPSGAAVTLNGKVVGTTPAELKPVQDDEELRYLLKREGYQDAPVTVTAETAGNLMVIMVKRPVARPAVTPTPRAKPASPQPQRARKKKRAPPEGAKPDKPKNFPTF